jgi:hypothetical protein
VQRILRGSVATLRSTKHNGDGEPVAPALGNTVTVQVTRSDGTDVLAAGTAATVAGAEVTVALAAAHTAELDQLTATWTERDDVGTVVATWQSTAEIVGGFYFTIAEARASDKTLEDVVKYPNADILVTRTEVEEEFETICGQAFVPRFATVAHTTASRGVVMVLLHVRLRRVRSVSVDDIAFTAEQVVALKHEPAGFVYVSARRGARVSVAYEHGWDAPPADVKRAALTRLRSRLNMDKSAVFDRTISFSAAEGGTYRLATPSARHTGIPDVDAVLDRYALRTPTVA